MGKSISRIIATVLVSLASSFSWSADIAGLGIEGTIGAGDVGQYPVDAPFSWIDHRYPDSDVPHRWTLAPGSDGGILLGQSQAGKGALTEVRAMYNVNSWLYSVDDGIKVDSSNALDFGNLRMNWGGTILDFGTVSGFDSLVPLISEMSQLSRENNGYILHADNTYDLILRSAGLCEGCVLTLHFHGVASSVPEPRLALLLSAGFFVVFGFAGRYRKFHPV